MTLHDWLREGRLRSHEPGRQEIAALLSGADEDLANCGCPGLGAVWRHNIAYNAALRMATAALAVAGYRPRRNVSHHVCVIRSLAHTVGVDSATIRQFDAARKKRNMGAYDNTGVISDQEADEMVALAGQLRRGVEAWVRTAQPELL